ncbi:MAG: hypothetical protein Q8878_05705 [Bacillota bacterium]|nr:hypothetical protein [Bacillota bacterium]
MIRSKSLLAAAILGSVYAVYIVYYCFDALSRQTETSAAVGTGIAIALMTPHIICVTLAVIFNWIGWSGNLRWAALASGILYAVSAVIFLLYAPFVLVQTILAFVGFAQLRKINEINHAGNS